MDEQTIYEQLINAGLKAAGDSLPKVISKINQIRLEEKKREGRKTIKISINLPLLNLTIKKS